MVTPTRDSIFLGDKPVFRRSIIYIAASSKIEAWGRTIAEAVSRWLPTATARVQSRVW
jgi:hypothetical protein